MVKRLFCSRATVMLIPSMAMLPRPTIRVSNSAGNSITNSQSVPSCSTETTVPTASTWPCTMWPSSRLSMVIDRSRFTESPSFNPPMEVFRRVSSTDWMVNAAASLHTQVWHAPLTEMLSSGFSSPAKLQLIVNSRPPLSSFTFSIFPVSSIIPVNMVCILLL